VDRRGFLKKIVKLFLLLVSLIIVPAIFYIYPSAIRQKKLIYIYLSDEDSLPKSGLKRFNYRYSIDDKTLAGYVFIKKDGNQLTAFSPICTHLGCLVKWDNQRKEFICACHGGKYDINGNVVAGPPPKPLDRLPVEIKEGKVYIGIRQYG
jgi:cytochrome b6-f complex iron-sulfur subunit